MENIQARSLTDIPGELVDNNENLTLLLKMNETRG